MKASRAEEGMHRDSGIAAESLSDFGFRVASDAYDRGEENVEESAPSPCLSGESAEESCGRDHP